MKILLTSLIISGFILSGCSTKGNNIKNQNIATNNIVPSQDNDNSIQPSNNNVTELLTESIYFDYNKYNVNDKMSSIVEQNKNQVQAFLNTYDTFVVSIEGHCDSRGSDEYNYALGLKRAQSIKKVLIENGINSNNIVTKSLGESSPVCTEETEECFAKNRRVEFIVE